MYKKIFFVYTNSCKFFLGGLKMEENQSIACTVSECRYHANAEDYCTLDQIQVGKTETPSKKSEDTDCESFQVK